MNALSDSKQIEPNRINKHNCKNHIQRRIWSMPPEFTIPAIKTLLVCTCIFDLFSVSYRLLPVASMPGAGRAPNAGCAGPDVEEE